MNIQASRDDSSNPRCGCRTAPGGVEAPRLDSSRDRGALPLPSADAYRARPQIRIETIALLEERANLDHHSMHRYLPCWRRGPAPWPRQIAAISRSRPPVASARQGSGGRTWRGVRWARSSTAPRSSLLQQTAAAPDRASRCRPGIPRRTAVSGTARSRRRGSAPAPGCEGSGPPACPAGSRALR